MRKEIIKNLEKVEKGAFLQDLLIGEDLSPYIYQVTFGIVENRILLDEIIREYSTITFSSIEKNTLNVLRMGLYEILFMDTPDYAVLNENVDLVNSRSKAFTNALFRKFLKDQEKIIKEIEKYPLDIRYSVNHSLYSLLRGQYQKKVLRKILSESLEKDDFVISIRKNKENLLKTLADKEYELEEIYNLPDSFIVKNPADIFELEEFKNGDFTVQKGSSSLASIILDPKPGERILDLCAAPGGKTAHLSHLMGNKGEIIANDLHPSKEKRMLENFERLQVQNVKLSFWDGTKLNEDWVHFFDKVLLDVPCSSTGRLSQYPEIKLFRTKEDILDLQKIQREIIKNSYEYLKIGGKLLYSTCSILKEENEDQMDFLSRYFKPVPINFFNPGDPFIKTLPFTRGMGGFFISLWEK